MTGHKPKEWHSWIPLAQWWYNNNFHSSLGTTPYEVMYGQPPPLHDHYVPGDSANPAVDRSLTAREEVLRAAKDHLLEAQNRIKQLADAHRSERKFSVGDWIYLKLHPFRQFTLLHREFHKLSPKHYGHL